PQGRTQSKNKSKASTKLHVGNINPACTNLELRAKFEEYGPVIECDIVKDYAFVHMEEPHGAGVILGTPSGARVTPGAPTTGCQCQGRSLGTPQCGASPV
uniref:RRM domain-containing protein n=1 Tax=Cyanistes caeruleus TaxID=156563 RepID=A0A8C0USQ2_CYACU